MCICSWCLFCCQIKSPYCLFLLLTENLEFCQDSCFVSNIIINIIEEGSWQTVELCQCFFQLVLANQKALVNNIQVAIGYDSVDLANRIICMQATQMIRPTMLAVSLDKIYSNMRFHWMFALSSEFVCCFSEIGKNVLSKFTEVLLFKNSFKILCTTSGIITPSLVWDVWTRLGLFALAFCVPYCFLAFSLLWLEWQNYFCLRMFWTLNSNFLE